MTVRGKAGVSWRREERSFELTVQVPVGTEAEVHLPLLEEAGLIKEGDSVIWQDSAASGQTAEILFLRRENEFVLFRVGSGFYAFRSQPAL
jgi:alpha-L-rhamnosidase